MNKINYHKKMKEQINELNGQKKRLLLHACCGPCSTQVLSVLNQFFHISLYFFNPNIHPRAEYERRRDTIRKLIDQVDFDVQWIEEVEDPSIMYPRLASMAQEKEGGQRCQYCIAYRMNRAARYANAHAFDYFTTTLSISPHKNAAFINQTGERLSDEYGITFLNGDFKKENGYLKSIQLSDQYDLYRQSYCGCVFSQR